MRKNHLPVFTALGFCALALMGCELFTNPSAMPAGYTYHNEVYKAPPGPDAPDIGYEYSARANEEILELWRVVISDLVDQLGEQTSHGPRALYLEALAPDNAFNTTYDNILREDLTGRGFTLTADPIAAPHLRYEAAPVENRDVSDINDPYFRDFALTLTLLDPAAADKSKDPESGVLARAAGTYKLPSYGYQKGPHIPFLTPVAGGQPQ